MLGFQCSNIKALKTMRCAHHTTYACVQCTLACTMHSYTRGARVPCAQCACAVQSACMRASKNVCAFMCHEVLNIETYALVCSACARVAHTRAHVWCARAVHHAHMSYNLCTCVRCMCGSRAWGARCTHAVHACM